jgi:hypothetical protein
LLNCIPKGAKALALYSSSAVRNQRDASFRQLEISLASFVEELYIDVKVDVKRLAFSSARRFSL